MRREKVAVDVSIPERSARMLNSGFGDLGYEFVYGTEFAAANSLDEFWADSFKKFGGRIVLSGDKNIGRRPHQIAAFKANGLICFFMLKTWASQDLAFKTSHLVAWWPRIQGHLPKCKDGDAYWVPMSMRHTPFKKIEIPHHVLEEATKRIAKK